jgi:hypothetical protein
MPAKSTFNRNFLLSLMGSLVLHLIVLIVILVPGNHRAQENPYNPVSPPVEKNIEFRPTLITRPSDEQLEHAMLMIDYRSHIIPGDSASWEKSAFANTFQSVLQKQNISASSISLQRSEINQSVQTITVAITSAGDTLLEQCLFTIFVVGSATLRSNFSTDNLVLICSSKEDNAAIKCKISTYDCRLFANKKLSGAQLIPKIAIF